MTIDEAIKKFKFIANSDAPCPRYCMLPCDKCVDESEQLAEWLEDYERIKMLIPIEQALKAEYNKAVDDLVNRMLEEGIIGLVQYAKIKEIAEQLKEDV